MKFRANSGGGQQKPSATILVLVASLHTGLRVRVQPFLRQRGLHVQGAANDRLSGGGDLGAEERRA